MMLYLRMSPGHRERISHLLLQFLHKKLETVTNSDMPWKRRALALREMGAPGRFEEARDSVCTSTPSHTTHTHTHTHTHIHTPLGSLSLTNSSDFVFLGHHLTFQ